MKRSASLAALFVLPLLAFGCSKEGRSLVQVTVTLGSGVTVDQVKLDALQSGSLVKSATFEWTAGQPTMVFGMYMPEGTSGTVNVDATGLLNDAANSHGSGEAKGVSGANTVTATIALVPGAPPPPDGGADMAGSGGSGGGAGSGGDGGTDVPVGSGGNTDAGHVDVPAGSGGAAGGSGGTGSGGTGSGGVIAKWGTPETIGVDPDTYNNYNYYYGNAEAAVSVNDSGTAMVAYANAGKLYVRRRAAHGTWMVADEIETRTGSSTRNPQIGVVSDGTAWVTWQQTATTTEFKRGIYEMHFNGTAWGTKRQILDDSATVSDGGAETISHYRMVVNEVDGTAVLASRWDSTRMHAMFRSAMTWTADTEIATWNITSGDDWMMDAAIDNNGQAVIVWYQGVRTTSDGGVSASAYDLMGCVGRVSSGWCAAPTKLNGSVLGDPTLPSVHLDRSGAGVVAWYAYNGPRIHARLIGTDGTFGNEQTVDSPLRADYPSAVMDRNQNAMVVWPHRTSTATPYTWNTAASRHVQGGNWQGTDLESQTPGTETRFGYKPAVAVNQSGKVTAVWIEDALASNDSLVQRILKGTRFDGTWATVARLDTGGATGAALFPQIASSDISTVVVWWQGSVASAYGADLRAIVFE